MSALLELLSATQWLRQQSGAQSFSASTTVTCPSGYLLAGLYPRFVRVQAIDGDLCLETDGVTVPDDGSLIVFQGAPEVYQLPQNSRGTQPVIKIAPRSGTVSGSVVWGF